MSEGSSESGFERAEREGWASMIRTKADRRAVEEGCWFDAERGQIVVDFIEGHCRHSKGEFAGEPFTLLDWERDATMQLYGWVAPDGNRRFRLAYIEVPKKNGKALALDTPIPTPDGWALMGELGVGDVVFDENGLPCTVVAATGVMLDRPCYRITFSDGCEIVADADHQWLTTARRTCGVKGDRKSGPVGIRSTREIAEHVRVEWSGSAGANHSVQVAGGLILPDAMLPIPPYVLGAWLGDGTSSSARITCAYADAGLLGQIENEGVSVTQGKATSETTGCYRLGGANRRERRALAPIQTRLRRLGLLGNKHIPNCYLRASYSQRMDLLQGLMDTDGTCGTSGQCVFTTTSPKLRDGFVELACSLGFKPTVSHKTAKIYGRVIGDAWNVQFHAFADTPVFRLERKRQRQKCRIGNNRPRSQSRHIIKVERVESVPVRCIQVDSPSHLFLAGRSMIPTHNSALCSALSLHGLCADGEAGAEVYNCACDRQQASIVFDEAATMAEQSPDLSRILTIRRSTKHIVYGATASKYVALSAEAPTKEGINASLIVFDELHAQKDRRLWDTMRFAGRRRRQPLTLVITTAGDNKETICWELHERARAILDGQSEETGMFAMIYGASEDDDWTDPAVWRKANPSFGVLISEDTMRRECEEAKLSVAGEGQFKRYCLNIWTRPDTKAIREVDWDACRVELDEASLVGRHCFVGLDLASVSDFAATVYLFPDDDGGYTILPRLYTPASGIEARARHDHAPYEQWAADGWIEPLSGLTIDFGIIRARLVESGEKYRLREVGFDPWNAIETANVLENEHGLKMVKVRQGPQSLSEACKALERLVKEKKLRHGGNPAFDWMMMNLLWKVDANENRRPIKGSDRNKIDGPVGLIIALAVALVAEPLPPLNPVYMSVW